MLSCLPLLDIPNSDEWARAGHTCCWFCLWAERVPGQIDAKKEQTILAAEHHFVFHPPSPHHLAGLKSGNAGNIDRILRRNHILFDYREFTPRRPRQPKRGGRSSTRPAGASRAPVEPALSPNDRKKHKTQNTKHKTQNTKHKTQNTKQVGMR